MSREKIPEYVLWTFAIVVVAVVVYAAIQGMSISSANRMTEFLKSCMALNETLTEAQCQAILALSRSVS